MLIAKKFYTIKEASELTKVPAHTLRYWEKHIKQLRPIRRESGHRRFTSEQIQVIMRIKELLYVKKYTIDGAYKELLHGKKKEDDRQDLFPMDPEAVEILKKVKKELQALFKVLSK